MPPDFYIVNESTLVTDDEAQAAVAAIQIQVTRDFAPAWGVSAVLHYVPKGSEAPPGKWTIRIVDTCNVDGALGYHDDSKFPAGIVGVKTCLDDGVTWTSCLSHEVLELIADPEAVRCFQFGNKILALEPADTTEGRGYKINGVEVSNFTYPSYFVEGSEGPWDHMGVLPGPYPSLDVGGYMSFLPLDQDWEQINAEEVRESKQKPLAGSRRARRRAHRAKRGAA